MIALNSTHKVNIIHHYQTQWGAGVLSTFRPQPWGKAGSLISGRLLTGPYATAAARRSSALIAAFKKRASGSVKAAWPLASCPFLGGLRLAEEEGR